MEKKTGKVKRFFYTDLFSVLYGAIEQGEEELQVTLDPQFKDFLAAFYTEASAGLLLEWVKNRMTQDRETVLQNLLAVYKISIPATLHLNMPKHGTKYPISEDSEKLIDLFLDYKGYGPNTRDDVVWVVRRYLHYFESLGYASLEWVTVEQVREFILKTAAEVKTSSLHNILLYLKHFHIFLKESSLLAPDCVELFSYRVYRDMMPPWGVPL